MASFRLNIARIQGSPAPAAIDAAMAEFALPDTEEFGVLSHSATEETCFATIIRKTRQAIQKLDAETQEILTDTVEKVTVYPFAIRPGTETLEIYAGGVAGIEQIGVFMASCLAMPTVVDPITLDVISAIDKLANSTQRFQLKSIRVSDYAHNSFMAGPYAPRFLDTEHGKDFLYEYADHVQSAAVRFQGPSGRVTVNLTPKACFRFSCDEEDQTDVQSVLRKLI